MTRPFIILEDNKKIIICDLFTGPILTTLHVLCPRIVVLTWKERKEYISNKVINIRSNISNRAK